MNLYELVRFRNAFVELFILSTGYYFLRAMIVSGAAAYFLESPRAVAKQIYRLPVEKPQIISELRAGIMIVVFDALVATLLIHFNWFRHSTQTVFGDLATWFGMFVWFEIWFYATHRLLHTKTFYFIHAQHHTARINTPLTALSFSFLDRLILVAGGLGFPVILSHYIPMSFLGYAAYFVTNYALNVYGHLNTEVVPPSVIRTSLGEIINSPSYHALHHARYQGHYGLFTPYLDKLFHSRFNDYELVHLEAYEGRGLPKLNQRLGLSPS